MIVRQIKKELRENSDKEKAKILRGFFKTAPGEYGYGDIFIGVVVPKIRKVAQKYKTIKLKAIEKLLKSPIHEERLLSLFILANKFKESNQKDKKRIYQIYCQNTKYINNWDLVDVTAPHVVGAFLESIAREPLYKFAKSKSLWERRIAIISTFHFIRKNSFDDTLAIAKILLGDKEDLIHKACGWMLREVAKRDKSLIEKFLLTHHRSMSRTTLRYAIERFPESERKRYLNKGK